MAWTVLTAFDQFRKNVVDLDSKQTEIARASRNYLFNQIRLLAQTNTSFPKLESSHPFENFGSFARKTKIKPLNDIDFLVLLSANNVTITNLYNEPYTYGVNLNPNFYYSTPSTSATLEQFADNYGDINSTKILNRIKSSLTSIHNYKKSEIKKTMQVVTLNLNSYDWVYDIVPAIPLPINSYPSANSFLLIPNGRGKWIATNPKIDAWNTTRINSKHNNKFLPTLRLLKYWNNRLHKPRLKSYYFETLAIKVFEFAPKIEDFPNAVKWFFDCCPSFLNASCPDPKTLGPNLDADIDWATKAKISEAMQEAGMYAADALNYNFRDDTKQAILSWKRIFGDKFPNYG